MPACHICRIRIKTGEYLQTKDGPVCRACEGLNTPEHPDLVTELVNTPPHLDGIYYGGGIFHYRETEWYGATWA